MERKTAHDFDQDLLILFDAYVHGFIDRRGFLDKAAKYAVGGVTAAMLLDQLSPKFLEAQVIKPEDSRIKVQRVEYQSPKGYGKMAGYLAQPARAAGKLPAILVIHAHRGHRASTRGRQLRRVRTRCVVSARRLPRRRGQSARGLPQTRSGENARGLHRGR